jgi:DNA-binding MarR family transcriptional regulator
LGFPFAPRRRQSRAPALLRNRTFRFTIVVITTIVSFVTAGKTQKRTTPSLESRVFVALLIAADRLSQQAEQLMKQYSLTGTQYNVLRILRGAEPHGLPCKGISDRMISHDPDMTRLLDRMEKRGLISRVRQLDDRRVVKTRISAQGLEILRKLDAPVEELHRSQFRNIAVVRLKSLAAALEEVPQTPEDA